MAVWASTQQKMDFFLIGKTGNGKSATGNTILGRKTFKESDAGHSATLITDVDRTDINGTIVKVVDGPGVMDTRKEVEEQRKDLSKKLSSGFVHCPDGFHALLLVLKYGNRITQEEIKTINILRVMFGPNFIKNHCVLIFTYGDNFRQTYQDETGKLSKTFLIWLKEQEGELRMLIEECQNRAVLFNNFDKTKRDEALASLFSAVQSIRNHYTNEMFQNIKKERTKFIDSVKSIHLKDHIQCDISLLNAMLNPMNGEPPKHVLEPLLERLEDALSKENGDLKVVKSLRDGIAEAKKGDFFKARRIFLATEQDGKSALAAFWKIVENIVMRVLSTLGILTERT